MCRGLRGEEIPTHSDFSPHEARHEDTKSQRSPPKDGERTLYLHFLSRAATPFPLRSPPFFFLSFPFLSRLLSFFCCQAKARPRESAGFPRGSPRGGAGPGMEQGGRRKQGRTTLRLKTCDIRTVRGRGGHLEGKMERPRHAPKKCIRVTPHARLA